MSEPGGGHEMIIVKRHGGAHDEHHGGVWKIAFADFMTAMMAFFLVMWLISANDKTKATIAKYFNPIELVDSTPQPRGLNDTKKDDPNVERKSETPAPDTKGKDNNPTEKSAPDKEAAAPRPVDLSPMDDADQSARHDELELIRDPYAVIAEIAAKRSADPPTQASTTPAPVKAAGGAGAIGLKNGEAFRDPFEPQSLASAANPLPSVATLEPPPSPVAPAAPLPATTPIPAPPAPMAAVTMDKPEIATAAAPATSGASPAGSAPLPAAASAVPGSPASAAGPVSAGSSQAGATGSAKNGSDGAAAVAATDPGADKPLPAPVLRAKIAALAKATEGPASGGTPKLEVQHTEEGTLISLTDTAEFTMFASASARPSPKTIALMEKIGRLLKAQKGGVTIRGFTDSRPFHSDTYDNWRLSTERAHIAQYMLERGGLDDGRLDRVEGYADRRPKNPKDPEGPENRRIEILLRDTTP